MPLSASAPSLRTRSNLPHPRKERFTVKKTPKMPRTASTRKPRATPRLRALFTRSSRQEGEERTVGRSFLRAAVASIALLFLCGVLMLSLVLTVSLSMVRLTAPSITSVTNLPAETDCDCILVLGAGVRDDGTPSPMLYDRVTVAVQLYEARGAPLLMSGDHTGDYNEVAVMKALAVEMGVPSEDIFLDHEGYSTFESLYRARYMFSARRVIIVTQEYHLHRALYIARELDMTATGVSADLRPYRLQKQYNAREHLARFKDFFTAAKGEYHGNFEPPVDLGGDGNLT